MKCISFIAAALAALILLAGCAPAPDNSTDTPAQSDGLTTDAEARTDAGTQTGEETAPVPGTPKEDIMKYTEAELQLFDEYLKHSAGVELSAYASGTDAQPLARFTVPDFCAMPDGGLPEKTKYLRYSAYVSFEEEGNQNLAVGGVKKADITVTYNELHTEKYSKKTVFAANVFYKINVGFAYKAGETAEFSSDSRYKPSVNAPTFGGVPSSEVKPLADIHLRDAFIMAGPDGAYYMTGTYDPNDWANTKEIHVYKSADLSSWEDLGAVWVYERDATWQKELIKDGSSPIWAPELHYINGEYYICYSLGWGAMNGSVLKSTTGKPEGPYEDISGRAAFDYIDSTFFVDDDGKVYAVWSDGLMAQMRDDMTKPVTSKKKVLKSASGMRVGFEGCFIMKINGLYYLCSATYCIHYNENGSPYQTYDSFYAVSDKLEGPYSERRLLLENGGHNNLFRSGDGKLYTTAFYGKTFSERPAIVEINVTEDGRLEVK